MIKNKKFIIGAFILGAIFFASVTVAATVLFPSGGGTGTNTKPGKGSVLVGASSTAYGVLATSTNGKVLTASSTASLGVSWESVTAVTTPSGATTQIQYNNGGTMAGDANLTWSSSTKNLTVAGTSTATNLVATGSSTVSYLNFSNATGTYITIATVSSSNALFNITTTTNLTIAGITGGTKCLHVDTNGVVSGTSGDCGVAGAGLQSLNGSTSSTQTFSAGSGISISTANGVHTFTNTAPNNNSTTTLTAGSHINVSNGGIGVTTVSVNDNWATGTIATATTTNLSVTSTLYFGDNTRQNTGERCGGFTISNVTSSDDLPVFDFPTTSTITKVISQVWLDGEKVAFQLTYNVNARTTSTFPVFSNYQTITATTTPTVLTSFASSTPQQYAVLHLLTTSTAANATSTLFHITYCYESP